MSQTLLIQKVFKLKEFPFYINESPAVKKKQRSLKNNWHPWKILFGRTLLCRETPKQITEDETVHVVEENHETRHSTHTSMFMFCADRNIWKGFDIQSLFWKHCNSINTQFSSKEAFLEKFPWILHPIMLTK